MEVSNVKVIYDNVSDVIDHLERMPLSGKWNLIIREHEDEPCVFTFDGGKIIYHKSNRMIRFEGTSSITEISTAFEKVPYFLVYYYIFSRSTPATETILSLMRI